MNRRELLRAGMAAAVVVSSGPLAGLAHGAAASFYDLEFPGPDGLQHPVSKFLGKPLVLNFWATWCPPCVKEMPDLDFLQQKHPDVTVVGLAVDAADNVRKFNEKVPVSYPILVAGHGGIQLMKEMGNSRGGLPYTILFDAQGQPIRHFLGQIDRDELDDILAGISSV